MSVVKGGLSNAQAQFNQNPATGIFAGSTVALPPQRFQSMFQNGILSDQIDGLSAQLLSFTASTPQTIALNALTDFDGAALTAVRARFVALKNLSQVDNDFFLVGDAVTDEWDAFISAAATLTIFPASAGAANDGFVIISAPGVTAMPIGGSNFNLKINPGTLAKQMILLIGVCSA
jgi:hypothetical protein